MRRHRFLMELRKDENGECGWCEKLGRRRVMIEMAESEGPNLCRKLFSLQSLNYLIGLAMPHAPNNLQ